MWPSRATQEQSRRLSTVSVHCVRFRITLELAGCICKYKKFRDEINVNKLKRFYFETKNSAIIFCNNNLRFNYLNKIASFFSFFYILAIYLFTLYEFITVFIYILLIYIYLQYIIFNSLGVQS